MRSSKAAFSARALILAELVEYVSDSQEQAFDMLSSGLNHQQHFHFQQAYSHLMVCMDAQL